MWRMFAHRSRLGHYQHVSPTIELLRRYSESLAAHEVNVVIAPDGKYRGVMRPDDDHPTMIQRESVFESQFPYGSDQLAIKGRGIVLNLDITPVDGER